MTKSKRRRRRSSDGPLTHDTSEITVPWNVHVSFVLLTPHKVLPTTLLVFSKESGWTRLAKRV